MSNRTGVAIDRITAFHDLSIDGWVESIVPVTPDDERANLQYLVSDVVDNVPAYRQFLAERGVNPRARDDETFTLDTFRSLPKIDKENYLRRYPLPELCRNGRLEDCDMIAVSSGSTGSPFFWPRFVTDELTVAERFEQIFHDSFRADERKTLAVICFALGTWVGGMYTASCCRHLALKGYPITTITPGSNRYEIFRVVTELGPLFDQVVLLGYPPFLKDVIDIGRARGVDWPSMRIKLVTAGEVFSEEWRTLVGERIGLTDPCFDSATLYGTADAGVLGNETPLSICIRRWLATRPDVARKLFGESRLPTLVQYDPLSRYFECENGSLIFSCDNGIPLIRYDIHDTGGILPCADMPAFLSLHGFDPVTELGPEARGVRPMPFVWVFGRSNFTISFFGANIYPENIAVGLEQPGVREWVSGKFVIEAIEDADRNLMLAVTIELAPGETGNDERIDIAGQSILTHLRRLNSEFANYVPAGRQTPAVTLLPAGDSEYFPAGVKRRYTRK